MSKNVITIKKKPRQRIARRADGSAVIRIRDDAAEAIEKLISDIDGDVNLIDIASQMLIYAAENTEIKIISEED